MTTEGVNTGSNVGEMLGIEAPTTDTEVVILESFDYVRKTPELTGTAMGWVTLKLYRELQETGAFSEPEMLKMLGDTFSIRPEKIIEYREFLDNLNKAAA